jgi:hypothetical protein
MTGEPLPLLCISLFVLLLSIALKRHVKKKSRFLDYLRRKTRTESCVTNGIRTRNDHRDRKSLDHTRHRMHGRCHWKALVYETAIIQNASLLRLQTFAQVSTQVSTLHLVYKSDCGSDIVKGLPDTMPFVEWVQWCQESQMG